MAAEVATDARVVDLVGLAEVGLGEHHSVAVAGDWLEANEAVVAIAITAQTSEWAPLALDLVDVDAGEHFSLGSCLLVPSLPLLGLHLDLEASGHSSEVPGSGDLALVQLASVLESVGTLVGLGEVNVVSAQLTLDLELSDTIRASALNLATAPLLVYTVSNEFPGTLG